MINTVFEGWFTRTHPPALARSGFREVCHPARHACVHANRTSMLLQQQQQTRVHAPGHRHTCLLAKPAAVLLLLLHSAPTQTCTVWGWPVLDCHLAHTLPLVVLSPPLPPKHTRTRTHPDVCVPHTSAAPPPAG